VLFLHSFRRSAGPISANLNEVKKARDFLA
jgi:hypothetical protein